MSDSSYLTTTFYTHIKDGEYSEATAVLEEQLDKFPRSQEALSLLAYCYYQLSDFESAARMYERLVEVCPDVEQYRTYYAQALVKSGAFADAQRVVATRRIAMLETALKLETGDLQGARTILAENFSDPEAVITSATIAFKEGAFEEALAKYDGALEALGFRPDVCYNRALCYYKLKAYDQAMECIVDLISRGLAKHPQLAPTPLAPDGEDNLVMAMDPSYSAASLRDTYLIEAYNLKAAIEFDTNNQAVAAATLSHQMPHRQEQDLDVVTLHNKAICGVGDDLSSSFRKLQFLLSNPPFPPETFANILLLYIKHSYEDLAADLLADHTELTYDLLSQELYDYIDASFVLATSPDDAFAQFDAIGKQILQRIRKGAKAVSEAELSGNDDAIASAHRHLAEAMQAFTPVLMQMAKIHWDAEDYHAGERLLRQSGEYCGDGNVCAINLGHAYFRQNKFREAALCYEPLVSDTAAILDIAPVILANLCVSYVLTDQNERAEEIIALVERAEEIVSLDDSDKQLLHGSIISLVIGTLYCQKNNWDFGMELVCKSLEPLGQKLGPDTWHYAKTCLLALLEKLSKQLVTITAEISAKISAFLAEVDRHGQKLSPTAADDEYSYMPYLEADTISSEARKLRLAFMRLV